MQSRQGELAPAVALDLLAKLPVGVLLADGDGKIRWVNQALCAQLGVEACDLIGKERSALPGRRTLSLSKSSEKLRVCGPSGTEQWFECVSQKVSVDQDIAELTCIYDVTHNRTQLKRGSRYLASQTPDRVDRATGLLNKSAIMRELTSQVSRSRRYGNSLSVIMIRVCDYSATPIATPIEKHRAVRALTAMLKEKLRWVDIVGCWARDEFLLVLPETSFEAAKKLAKKIESYLSKLNLLDSQAHVTISIGVTDWRKTDDTNELVERVRTQHEVNEGELAAVEAV